ncbi:hypothetical protein CWB85_09785 [Pseudoalteromonas sp. S1727]|uniref:ABC-three component system middle component 5 n=1 Tax=Pseudoalteromonas sp. S1727 TaxID=2066514 RepID=UPI00127F0756|nr:ABC-three component system middle component 5 [Pseudoalteromonas sp. S1727]TMN71708.1 hypothetical protein CWB85_09785 [Pseudoalteromonas sp. S1727]
MLLYHPLTDVNHCMYRLLNLTLHIEGDIQFEKLRVVDFYYLFPHLLNEIKPWPTDIKKFKKFLPSNKKSFEHISNKKKVFFELNSIQKQAIAILVSKDLINIDKIKNGVVSLNKEKLPEAIYNELGKDSFSKSDCFSILTDALINSNWNGKNGLKLKTGLLEYRYD